MDKRYVLLEIEDIRELVEEKFGVIFTADEYKTDANPFVNIKFHCASRLTSHNAQTQIVALTPASVDQDSRGDYTRESLDLLLHQMNTPEFWKPVIEELQRESMSMALKLYSELSEQAKQLAKYKPQPKKDDTILDLTAEVVTSRTLINRLLLIPKSVFGALLPDMETILREWERLKKAGLDDEQAALLLPGILEKNRSESEKWGRDDFLHPTK